MTSHDPERPSRDPNTLKAEYLDNSWRCYLGTISIVCFNAVRSAILATAWLLVHCRLCVRLIAICHTKFCWRWCNIGNGIHRTSFVAGCRNQKSSSLNAAFDFCRSWASLRTTSGLSVFYCKLVVNLLNIASLTVGLWPYISHLLGLWLNLYKPAIVNSVKH